MEVFPAFNLSQYNFLIKQFSVFKVVFLSCRVLGKKILKALSYKGIFLHLFSQFCRKTSCIKGWLALSKYHKINLGKTIL